MEYGKKIKLFAMQIPYHEEELEEGEVFVRFDVEELLNQIEEEDIIHYARNYCDLIHPDDINLGDYDESDLVEALEDKDYTFIHNATNDDMIERLENEGYYISLRKPRLENADKLDYGSQLQFDAIERLFYRGSWAEREEMYKKLTL
jgi:hypothetical protein